VREEEAQEKDMAHGPWLVVGLGNPGTSYADNRHNLGFKVVDELARRFGATFTAARGAKGSAARVRLGTGPGGVPGPAAILLKPMSYMNRSGSVVAMTATYFAIPTQRVLVVHDDLDLDLGRIRLRFGGGEGGHNGLRDVSTHLGTRDYLRVRLGIGRPPGRMDPAKFVLRSFTTQEQDEADLLVARGADAVEETVQQGLEAAQLRWHTLT